MCVCVCVCGREGREGESGVCVEGRGGRGNGVYACGREGREGESDVCVCVGEIE